MTKAIHWFRQDLRLSDNPALHAATSCDEIFPIYIYDDCQSKLYQSGAATNWWLHHSIASLSESLDNKLNLFCGDPLEIISDIVNQYDITHCYWNRCYEPWQISRDKKIKKRLTDLGVVVESTNGSLLWEPWTNLKADGTPYKVFTPFFRKGCLNGPMPRQPLRNKKFKTLVKIKGCTLDDLALLGDYPWYKKLEDKWTIGEQAAQKKLRKFLSGAVSQYKKGRDFPALNSVSKLSPHLHFGEISPNQIFYDVKRLASDSNTEHFLSELGWREFSYSQLYHFPGLPNKNWQSKFDRFTWQPNKKRLIAWQQGQTGIPFVDAGMRELWQTGYMHNRVRMVVGSFLVKNLRINWREGERWFWDTLVDADLANNSASWQWVAGCGADAAPYFRIFNPVTQGQKFDSDGEYTLKYVPELKALPKKYLFCPWEAPEDILKTAGIKLGQNYPFPIVDLKASRESALAAFAELKEN